MQDLELQFLSDLDDSVVYGVKHRDLKCFPNVEYGALIAR